MAERLDTGGLRAALALLGASGGLVDDSGSQVDLFEAEDAPLPLPTKGRSGPQGGRPAGARNRSTDEWVRLFLAQHRSPLSVLGNIMSQDLGELHELLQDMADKRTRTKMTAHGVEEVRVLVDPLAVLKLQRDTAAALLPYIHKQQPKALEISEKPRGVMVMGDLAEVVESGPDDALAIPLARPIEKQQEIATFASQSDTLQSDTPENASESNPLAWNGD